MLALQIPITHTQRQWWRHVPVSPAVVALVASGLVSLTYMLKLQASEKACIKQKIEGPKGHLSMSSVFYTHHAHRYPETLTQMYVHTHVPKTTIHAI